MNESNAIIIQPVANGWVITMPFKFENPNGPVNFAKAVQMMQSKDPLLMALQGETEKEKSKEPERTNHVFIFDSFEKVLDFLSKKYV